MPTLPDGPVSDKEYIEYLKQCKKDSGWTNKMILEFFLEYKKFQKENKTN